MEQDLDFTIHDLNWLHGKTPMISPPFRTNYYAFLLIESGKSSYTIDDHTFPLGAYSYYFTNPGHVKAFDIEENLNGFMVTFSESFLKTNYPGNIGFDFPFLFDVTVPVMVLRDHIFQHVKGQCESLIKEYHRNSPYKERILANHLVNLLFQTKELLLAHKTRIEPGKRTAEIALLFKSALNRNFLNFLNTSEKHLWNVQDYANHLNIHANHLSSIVKSETGKTIKQWIHEKIITEAKSMLKNTNKTISEIGYTLFFNDPSNFNRFFKNNTGQTPNQFRNLRK